MVVPILPVEIACCRDQDWDELDQRHRRGWVRAPYDVLRPSHGLQKGDCENLDELIS